MTGYQGQYQGNNDDFFDLNQPTTAGQNIKLNPTVNKVHGPGPIEANTGYSNPNVYHNNYGNPPSYADPLAQPTAYEPLAIEQPMTGDDAPFDYNNAGVRLGFIRKVYIIICFMLLFTFGLVAISYFVQGFRDFQVQNWWLAIVASVLMIILMYVLGCFRSVARAVPWNYLLLFLFTLCMAYIVSFGTASYNGEAIIIAVGITAAVVIALTIYAMCTSTDFTVCWGLAIVLGVIMIIGSIIGIILRNRWFDVGMAAIGCLVFGFYLVVDTQLVIGKNSRAYSVDDYVMAAVAIYIDIINLFLEILKLVAVAQGNR